MGISPRGIMLGRFAQHIAETQSRTANSFFGANSDRDEGNSGSSSDLSEENERYLQSPRVSSGSRSSRSSSSSDRLDDYTQMLSGQMFDFMQSTHRLQQQSQQRRNPTGQSTESQYSSTPHPSSNATLGQTAGQSTASNSDEIEEVLLGITGNTGRSTGPHLDIRYGRNYDSSRRRPDDEHLNRIMVDGKPLTQWTITSEHRSRNPRRGGHDGIDYGTPVGRRITTTHRIRRVSNPTWDPGGGGYYTSVEFEDGVTLNLLHQDGSVTRAGVGTRTRRNRGGSNATSRTGVQGAISSGVQTQNNPVLQSLDQAFQGGQNSLIARAVGHSEGNRDARGGFTSSYRGHIDPGNRVRNVGSFSYQTHQGGASTPEQADQLWLNRLRQQVPRYEQAARRAGLNPNDTELLLNFKDLYTQSPSAATERGGFLDQLPSIARSQNRRDAILQARLNSYVNPSTGQLDAPGFGNNANRLRADQQRRMAALAAVFGQ